MKKLFMEPLLYGELDDGVEGGFKILSTVFLFILTPATARSLFGKKNWEVMIKSRLC